MAIPRRYTITRHALYDLVWSKPLEKVAAKLGIREAELVSLCLERNVPRPWSGYWGLKVLGKPAEPIALPEPENDCEFEIRPQAISASDPVLRREVATEMIRIRESRLFTVAEDLRDCHSLVSRSQRLLMAVQWDDNGMIRPPKGSLAIKVSKGNIPRALLLMDAILKGFEGLGFKVGLGGEWQQLTLVDIMGIAVSFEIREYWLMEDRILSDSLRFQLAPAGRLRLEAHFDSRLGRGMWVRSIHRRFDDTKTKPLEVRLKAIAQGVVDLAARGKEAQAKAEERERERERIELEARNREQAARQQREAKLAKIMEEQERVDGLISESKRWAKSNRLRDYIKAKMARAEEQGEDVGPNSDTGKWRKWALDQADRLDPLAKSPPSVLDDE